MKSSIILAFVFYAAIAAGYRNKNRKIANHGELAGKGEYPFQVSLRYDGDHFCGGSLISRYHVLTAAHCIDDVIREPNNYPLEDHDVEVGMIQRGSGRIHKIKRISHHPEFKDVFSEYDIAVIHLLEPVVFSDKVSKIDLPKANTPVHPCTKVFISGYGAEVHEGPKSPVLKVMDAQIVSLAQCQKTYKNVRLNVGNLCAAKGKDYGICTADSGGPLVDKTRKTILGVVSASKQNCKSGSPDIFTAVSQYIPYITSELNYNPNFPGAAANNPSVNMKKK